MGKGSRRRPQQISDREFSERWELAFGGEKPAVSQDEFKKHLIDAAEIVSKWPKWKQELLGGIASTSSDSE